jgi:FtsP/CotA-like multicopper oxidase with cupredoxin domain
MFRRVVIGFALALLLAACGQPGSTTTTGAASTTTATSQSTTTETAPSTTGATTSTTAATTTSASVEVPRIKVEEGAKTEGLDTISVRVGETVRFEVEADIADEIHVHGYDLSFETVPGEEVLVEFVADATGIFEVEIEGLALPIVDIEVTP